MKLVVDVGNTRIILALFSEDKIVRRLSCDQKEQYCCPFFSMIFKMFIDKDEIDACYLSCVVPALSMIIHETLKDDYPNVQIVDISSKLKSNVEYKCDDPNEMGADLVADLAIGKEKYGYPLLICDLGTATKVLFINKNGDFDSCVIIPGMTLSLKSLVGNTALLPDVDIEETSSILAKNTNDAMNAGVVYSHLYGLEGICEQFEKEAGVECKRIITGGCASKIVGMIPDKFIYDKDFLLEGIYYLGKLNEVSK